MQKIKRTMALALTLVMIFTMIPLRASAVEGLAGDTFGDNAHSKQVREAITDKSQGDRQNDNMAIYVNPIYVADGDGYVVRNADYMGVTESNREGPSKQSDSIEAANTQSSNTYTTIEEAGAILRTIMVERVPGGSVSFSIAEEHYVTPYVAWEELCDIAYQHTENPKEGDSLYFSILGASYLPTVSFDGETYCVTFSHINFDYMLTENEDTILDEAIQNVLQNLSLEGMSDYEKIWEIYTYVCKNVTYDYDHTSSNSNSSEVGFRHAHSAYGALINGKAVCQGYALLLYRLLLESGVDNRIVAGRDHAWNIIELDGVYYNVDSTNDAVQLQNASEFQYFLKGSGIFRRKNYGYQQYHTAEFVNNYPVSPLDYNAKQGAEPTEILASGQCGDTLWWEINGAGDLTVFGEGNMWNYDQYTSAWEYMEGYINRIIISDGVEMIGDYAFYNCSAVQEIRMADTVTHIGNCAMKLCDNLVEVSLPNSVRTVGSGVFSHCARLKKATLSNQLEGIGEGMFSYCQSLQHVDTFPGLTFIGDDAFGYCRNLEAIEIPDGVVEIGDGAFSKAFPYEGEHMIVMPDSITSIGASAFSFSGLETVVFSSAIEYIGLSAFYHAYKLRSIELPKTVEYIGSEAFSNCVRATQIILPDTISFIGHGAFNSCELITEIVLPEGLLEINESTFAGCTSLRTVSIPDSVEFIGSGAFGSTAIETIKLPFSLREICSLAFCDCDLLEKINIPANVISIGEGAFGFCDYLKEVYFEGRPPLIYSAGYWPAFRDVSATCFYPAYYEEWTTDVMQNYGGHLIWRPYSEGHTADEAVIENLVEATVESEGRYDCVVYCVECGIELSRYTVIIPIIKGNELVAQGTYGDNIDWEVYENGLLRIRGTGAMPNNFDVPWHKYSYLIRLCEISNGITSLGDYAFYRMHYLQDISIPDSIIQIGSSVFYNCRRLEEVHLPNSVEEIGCVTFSGCMSLKSITIPNGVTDISWGLFTRCTALKKVYGLAQCTSIGNNAFSGCSMLTDIELSNSLHTIEYNAFFDCVNLKNVIIPNSVKEIGNQVFGMCEKLSTVYFEGDAPVFGKDVFDSVNVTVYYPSSNITWVPAIMQHYGGNILWKPYCAGEHIQVIDAAVAPTCTESGLSEGSHCSACNETIVEQTEIPALGHDMGQWKTTKEAACTEKGTKQRECNRCDHTETEEIPAKAHSYESVVTEPDCSSQGYTTHTCVVCGDSYADHYTDVLGHSFTDYVSDGNAGCTVDGTMTAKCDRCDATDTKTDVGSALGHSYTFVVTEPTCQDGGYTTHTCTACGHSYVDSYVDALGHKPGATVVENKVEATCETDGHYDNAVYCSVCNEELSRETITVPATGHSYGAWQTTKEPNCTETGEKQRSCSACGKVEKEVLPAKGHSYKSVVTAPTCEDRGYTTHTCSVCGHSYVDTYVDALGHKAGATVVENRAEATCETDGHYDNVVYCSVCNEELSRETVTIPATGHSFGAWQTTKEPTCTETGEKQRSCSSCGKVETELLPSKGHSYKSVVTAPTCTEEGFTVYTCSTCGDSYTSDYVAPKGHSYESVVVEPSCTKQGYTIHTCTVCSDSYKDSYVDAKGHAMGDWYVVAPAACMEDGEERRDCTACDHYESRTIPAIGHTWDEGIVIVEPTEESEGEKLYTCTACGETRTEVIPSLEHVHSYESIVTDPTCTEKGYTTFICRCGDSYRDNFVDELGHDMSAWTVVKEAACTENGEEHRGCSRCAYAETREIPATGHSYESVVSEPGCSSQGYTTHTCVVCGDCYADHYTDALGHSFTDYVSDGNAGCTVDGTMTAKCDRCDATDTKTAVGSALGHSHTSVVTEPTCEDKGYTTYTCTKCGDSYVDSYTDPVDHVYEDGYCKWCDEGERYLRWYSGTTSLNGTIDLNIYVLLSQDLVDSSDAFVRFIYDGQTVDVPMAEALHSPTGTAPNRYRFSCPIYAKQLADNVTVKFLKGDQQIGKDLNYSVVTYCVNQIKKVTNPQELALYKAMLNYGAAAQLLFNHNVENLANASLSEADKVLPTVDASAYKYAISGKEEGIRAKSATLMLEDVVKVRVYFALTGTKTIEDYTFTIDGEEVAVQQNEKGYYVESNGIAAKDLEHMFSIQVGGITVKYGALSYVNSMANGTKELEANISKALFVYWQAAEALLG